MNITDVENMDAATLKSKKAEAIEAVKDAPELAPRYVQARLDATMRDVKLAEQGRTITALQDAAEASKKFQAELKNAFERAEKSASSLRGRLEVAQAGYTELQVELDIVQGRLAKAEALAKGRRTVLADVVALINPKLAEE